MAAINKHSVQHAFIVCCAIVCNTCKLANCMLHNCNNCMLNCILFSDVQLALPDIECAMDVHVYAHATKQLLISKCICCCVHAYDVCMHVQATCVVSICLGLYQTPMAQNCVANQPKCAVATPLLNHTCV